MNQGVATEASSAAPASIRRDVVLRRLQVIPGIGPRQAEDLWRLGIRSVEDLTGADPEALYDRLCALKRTKIDRCQLYTFRCAVYFASRKTHKPELLKWWNWKDRTLPIKR